MSQSESTQTVHTTPAQPAEQETVLVAVKPARIKGALKSTFSRFIVPTAVGVGAFALLKKLDEKPSDEPETLESETDFTL